MAAAPRRSLASDALAIAAGAILTQVAALLSLMALARLLPRAELGTYQQLFLLYSVLSPLLLAGVPAALLYFLASEEDEAGRGGWMGAAYLLVLGTGLLFSVAVLLARGAIADLFNNPELEDLLALWAPYPLIVLLTSVMPSALIAVGRARLSALVNTVAAVVLLAGVVIGGAIGEDARSATVGLLIAVAVNLLVSLAVVARAVGIGRPRAVRSVAAYGMPLALAGVVGMLGYQFDRVVVSAEFDPADFAVYALGAVELPISLLVQQSVNNVLAPELTRHWRAGQVAAMGELWREAIRKTSLVLLPVFAFSMVFAEDLVRILFGDRYEDSVPIFRVYLCLIPLRVATYGLIPQAIGRTGINLQASGLLVVGAIALVLALVGPLGLIGPAVGIVGATVLVAAFYLVRMRAILGMTIRSLFPWKLLGVNLALSALAAVPVVPLALLEAPALVRVLAGGAVYLAAYLAIMRATRRIDDEDWARLKRRRPA